MPHRPTAAALCALLLTAPILGALLAAPGLALPPPAVGASTPLSNPFNETADVQMVYSTTGEGLAVWRENNGSTNTVWSARFVPGQGWGPATFHYAAGSSVGYLVVGMDDAGTGTLVWVTFSTPQRLLYARAFPSVAPLAPIILHNATGTFSGAVAMRVSSSGSMFAFWSQSGPSQSFAVVVDAGGVVDGPVRVDGGSTAVFEKDVLPEPLGTGATALWCDRSGTVANLTQSRYDPAGGWSSPAVVASNLSNGCATLGADIDAAGNIAVVFHASLNRSLLSIQYTVGVGWAAPVAFWTHTGSDAVDRVVVKAGTNGRLAVAWRTTDFPPFGVSNLYATSYSTAGGWAVATRLVENLDTRPNLLLAAVPEGSAVAVFSPIANSTYVLGLAQLTHLSGCSGWSAPLDAGVGTVNDNYLAVGLARGGDGHVVYRTWNGAVWRAHAAAISLDLPSASITVTSPSDGAHVTSPVGVVNGTTTPGALVTAGGASTRARADGTFSLAVPLLPGANDLDVQVELGDPWTGCGVAVPLTVVFDDPVPGLIADLDATRAELNATVALLSAAQADLAAAHARIDVLSASGNVTQAELDATLAELAAANGTIERMKGDFTRITSNLTAAQEELDRVKVQFPWLEANLSAAQANVTLFKGEIATLEAQYGASVAALDLATARILLLEAQQNQTTTLLQESTDNNAALSGQVATLSLIAFLSLLAAVAAIGLSLVQARRGGSGGSGGGGDGRQSSKVTVRGWDPEKKEEIRGKAEEP